MSFRLKKNKAPQKLNFFRNISEQLQHKNDDNDYSPLFMNTMVTDIKLSQWNIKCVVTQKLKTHLMSAT